MNIKKKARGRPIGSTSDKTASERLPSIRITPEQLTSYKEKALSSDKSLSAWVKETLDKAAKKK